MSDNIVTGQARRAAKQLVVVLDWTVAAIDYIISIDVSLNALIVRLAGK